jgi:nitroreductase
MEKLAVAERISPQRIIQALNWRYATKVFDPVKKIPEELFDQLIEVLRLAPSSIGLQPWKFIIVKNPTIRKQLKKYSMDQSQLVDSSHLIIICSLKHIDEAYVDRVIATEKLLSPDSPLEKFKSFALGYLNSLSKEEQVQWMAQ